LQATQGNFDLEAARRFHDLTKHSYTSVRSGNHYLDWDNEPFKFKLYPQAPALALPRELGLSQVPAIAALSRIGAPIVAPAKLDIERLSRILFCAGGLTRSRRVGDRDYHFRAAPSAGALYPIEVYLSAAGVGGLAGGLYHFCPADLKLRTLRKGDWRAVVSRACSRAVGVASADAVLFLSAIFWRSAWKYRARAYRYCFWDAGTILANLAATAAAEGIQAQVVTAFVDREIEHLLGIDGEHEGALSLVLLSGGDDGQMRAPTIPADALQTPPELNLESLPLSGEERTFQELIRLHQASKLCSSAEVEQLSSARPETHSDRPADLAEAAPSPVSVRHGGDTGSPKTAKLEAAPASLQVNVGHINEGLGLGETILRRGSTRRFARKPLSAGAMAHVLAAASRRPQIDFPALSDLYLIINAAEGVAPGSYFYRRETQSLELLKAGELRGQAGYLCLEQPLGADCSMLLCFMADLERVMRALGNRGYRDAHLEAGILGGNAYLAAYALGLGATGLTFYDDDTSEFFAPHSRGKSPLLMVAVGTPARAADG
jgi:SagB-type dehydrogenase family enzyme